MKRFYIGLPQKMIDEIDQYTEPGISRSLLIREAVRNYLKIRKENGGK